MYFYMTAGLILFRCIEIGFYKTLSSLYQLTNNNNNNNTPIEDLTSMLFPICMAVVCKSIVSVLWLLVLILYIN